MVLPFFFKLWFSKQHPLSLKENGVVKGWMRGFWGSSDIKLDIDYSWVLVYISSHTWDWRSVSSCPPLVGEGLVCHMVLESLFCIASYMLESVDGWDGVKGKSWSMRFCHLITHPSNQIKLWIKHFPYNLGNGVHILFSWYGVCLS